MTEYTAAKDALLMYVANAAMAIPHNLEYRAAHVDCSKMIGLIMAAQQPAVPKPSASTLPQRLRANSYNAPTWNDCDVMREAAHALENKDAEIAAVIRDNDEKLAEIEGLKAERLALRAKLADPRNPDIEAAAKRLENIAVPITSFHRHFGASSHIGELTDVGRITVARAILTREPG